ncbi:CHAD domain-containing protein [Sphingomonas sp. LB-2]|uniref:CYTH and CHAD domain-containing protein n=1 Tax=Sphingomonas caeni TaxID=2984949 RepID=UPI002231A3EE|nr:CHAD domain-containing protein [Sphingomonas caeni]MCW3846006.1 CHAD domain-containing protein [Sphingomonas caeni]
MPTPEFTGDPREIELKFDYDGLDRDRLLAALGALSRAGSAHQLVSTYFDTPARDIGRAGYTLRVRRDGGRRIQTVKAVTADAGLFQRGEWEHPVRGDVPRLDHHSGPLAEVLDAAVLGRIAPVFVTDVRRTLFRFDDAGSAFDVAVDDGEVRTAGGAERLCEVELELRCGTPRVLFDLARSLNEQVPLRLGVRSKAERGFALADDERPDAFKAEPIQLDPESDAADAFGAIARACIRQFRLNETRLLETGAAEALHQARVGLRRLRSAFTIHASLLSHDPRTDLLRAELRWLAAELGEVRNIDVLIPRVGQEAGAMLRMERDRLFEHVRAELAGARTRLLMIDLTEWLTAGAWRTEPAHPARLHREVGAFARNVLEKRCGRLRRRGEGLSKMDREHWHRVRIEAKKLRYASEFFVSLYTGDRDRRRHKHFLQALEALQDQLGELNDLVVGPQLLAKLGIDAELPNAGKHAVSGLLDRADNAFRALLRTKHFW